MPERAFVPGPEDWTRETAARIETYIALEPELVRAYGIPLQHAVVPVAKRRAGTRKDTHANKQDTTGVAGEPG